MSASSSILPGDLTQEAFRGDLSELGWKGPFGHDHPQVDALRSQLQQQAGIAELELIDPATPGFAQRAAELLDRDGYVVVKDILDGQRLETIRRGCEIAIREMVGRDPGRSGNRGSHRYSFGSAPVHFGLQDLWSVLIDPPPLMEIMEAIFGTKDFVTHSGSGGGDYNVPGSVEYQRLHSDGAGGGQDGRNGRYPDVKLEYLPDGQTFGDWPGANRRTVAVDAPEDPACRYEVVNSRDLPVREYAVTVNYPMEIRKGSEIGHTAYNGATRQIPGTQSLDGRNGNPIPTEEEEPLWMKLSTTAPCPAGSAMIRDARAWHGGTPNLGEFVRAIPHPGLYMLPTSHRVPQPGEPKQISLPYEIWEKMTPQGQHICRNIHAEKGQQVPAVQWAPDWAGNADAVHKGLEVAKLPPKL